MRISFIPAICGAVIAIIGHGIPATAADAPELVGQYKCVGESNNGKEYQGVVEITKDGDCYKFKWQIGKETYTGVAILEGNILSVANRLEGTDEYTGIVVYKIEKGGKLTGKWTGTGLKGKIYTETLTLQKPDKPPKKEASLGSVVS
jgi:hypothetical protein